MITRISKLKALIIGSCCRQINDMIVNEDNHVIVRKKLNGFRIILSRYEKDAPIWKTRGKYIKEMKSGYSTILYNQRNKDETIVSVIKRLFGEHIVSSLIRMQNREVTFRGITYNVHRMINLIIIKWIRQILFLPLISNKM